jgi:hypothetical protein
MGDMDCPYSFMNPAQGRLLEVGESHNQLSTPGQHLSSVDLQGLRVTSDAGLLLVRELHERLV